MSGEEGEKSTLEDRIKKSVLAALAERDREAKLLSLERDLVPEAKHCPNCANTEDITPGPVTKWSHLCLKTSESQTGVGFYEWYIPFNLGHPTYCPHCGRELNREGSNEEHV